MDPTGLDGLYGSVLQWATQVHEALGDLGYIGSVVVGYHRFSVFALARINTGPTVTTDANAETLKAHKVPLSRLNLSPKLRDDLHMLGVVTLGQFLRLPGAGLRARYGPEAAALYDLASRPNWVPLRPDSLERPLAVHRDVEPPDDNISRLMFGAKELLHGLLAQIEARSHALTGLVVTLELDHAPPLSMRFETAAPTLNVVQITDLLRLRLDALTLPAPVTTIHLEAETALVHPRQLSLLGGKSRRDLDAAARALARIKAAFGPQSVTTGSLRSAWLPEASYFFEPLPRVRSPAPRPPSDDAPRFIRHILPKPKPLPSPPRHEPESWLGLHGAVVNMFGPSRLSGGWWGKTVERDYHWVETTTGEVLWVYYDRPRRGWYLHGWLD